MPDFAHMTFDELIRPEGYKCNCGRVHRVSLKYLKIGRGVIASLPEMLATLNSSKPFVVCDKNTYEAAGKKAIELIEAAGIKYVLYIIPGEERLVPGEYELGCMAMNYDPSCDLILAVGSGVINDLCKMLGHVAGVPSAVVGTAPSMDGYASSSSSMEVQKVKTTIYNACPQGIICDADIMAQAPMRMLWAGLGDMLAKYVSVCEWQIANIVVGEYCCEAIADMMRVSLKKIVAAAPGIPNRDPDAVCRIAEGLVMAGLAMSYAEVSRPASGIEHYFSHVWDMMALERGTHADLHGIQVGIGTLITFKLYDMIKTITPDRNRAEEFIKNFDSEKWAEEVRRVFGKTAPEILAVEEKNGKNLPENHAKRLDAIISNWDKIQAIIARELPDSEKVRALMEQVGEPTKPSDIGVCKKDVLDAYFGTREIRNKYICSALLWDLGMYDDAVNLVSNLEL